MTRYSYQDEQGAVLFEVCRTPQKKMWMQRPGPDGTWINNLDGSRRVPYRLPKVLEAVRDGVPILIVEGEKDVHTAERLGFAATTAPGGGVWREEYNTHFSGANVVVIPDEDEPGLKKAKAAVDQLTGVAASVRLCRIPDVPRPGYDLSDAVADGVMADDIAGWFSTPPRTDPPTEENPEPSPRVRSRPTIPREAYTHLPRVVRAFLDRFDSGRARDVVLLSSLAALSAALPGVRSHMGKVHYSPHLYMIIIGPPASGKGQARFGFELLEGCDRIVRERSAAERAEWGDGFAKPTKP